MKGFNRKINYLMNKLNLDSDKIRNIFPQVEVTSYPKSDFKGYDARYVARVPKIDWGNCVVFRGKTNFCQTKYYNLYFIPGIDKNTFILSINRLLKLKAFW